MPITRRKRANPPEQPENTNQASEQTENVSESPIVEHATGDVQPAESQQSDVQLVPTPTPPSPVGGSIAESAPVPYQSFAATTPATPAPIVEMNGERKELTEKPERVSRLERMERHEYTPTIEGGRRTSRGELFRRPPQPPVAPPVTVAPVQPPLQAPSHEISLPLGNLLHLAYNPGYTGSDEARSELLEQLSNESKAGGRARCWSCGSIAIVYDRWNTRSKTFGEVGVAFCEICGVWSVM
jgi:hypothetical protein